MAGFVNIINKGEVPVYWKNKSQYTLKYDDSCYMGLAQAYDLSVKKNGEVIVVGYEQSCKKDELGDYEMKATYWINKKLNYLPCDSCVTSEASSIQVVK